MDDINIILYQNENPTVKNRVFFTQNVVSFLIAGEKEIFFAKSPITLHNQIAIIKASNCLMTEKKINPSQNYQSLLIFFDNQVLSEFKIKYKNLIDSHYKAKASKIVAVPNDKLLISYRKVLENLIHENKEILTPEFKKIKFEELFLYLLHNYPQQLYSILNQNNDEAKVHFKSLVENNALSNLSLIELAFLCNMSVSTFKRHFQKYYAMSPQKWFLAKRMENAQSLLEQGSKPSQVFRKSGYHSFSNFSRAYKKYFGKTPAQF